MQTVNICKCGWWRQSDSVCPTHGKEGTKTFSLAQLKEYAYKKDTLIDTIARAVWDMNAGTDVDPPQSHVDASSRLVDRLK